MMSALTRWMMLGWERVRGLLGERRDDREVLGFACDDDLYIRLMEDR